MGEKKKESQHFFVSLYCLNCHKSYWDVRDKSCKPRYIPERIYDIGGRAIPPHPGLA